ncbi:MAG: hypothetical protein ACYTG5_18425 [Planctomycetota bacterium]
MPACVYNNTSGDADERVLKSFDERAWNNPVVRFIDADRKDIFTKIDRHWTVPAMTTGMLASLRKSKVETPLWLEVLGAEENAKRRELDTAIFGMT